MSRDKLFAWIVVVVCVGRLLFDVWMYRRAVKDLRRSERDLCRGLRRSMDMDTRGGA